MKPTKETHLREVFEAARREEARQAPAFSKMWRLASAGSTQGLRRKNLALALVGVAAATLVFLVVMQHLPRHEAPLAPAPAPLHASALSTDWAGPLDFLLEPPAGPLFSAPSISTDPYAPKGVTRRGRKNKGVGLWKSY